ncbi:uncharacterized protein N7473_008397 [Penicillium subrubescens]|nr:uncharacterized protein N7473_008397 [Penicillium subrubescens]KAJ5892169.1 hypothetical protein N7473_008397 [Penicillium subrubescens]
MSNLRLVETVHDAAHIHNDGGWVNDQERELLDLIGMTVKRKKAKHAGMGKLENMKNRPMILIDDPALVRHLSSAATFSMGDLKKHYASLQAHLATTEAPLVALKHDLASPEKVAEANLEGTGAAGNQNDAVNDCGGRWPLLLGEYTRYGRQMIVPQVGLED